MRLFIKLSAILLALAILLQPRTAGAQTTLPTWSFEFLNGQHAANSNGIVSGTPIAGTYVLNYTFNSGRPLTPGSFEIGGKVSETDQGTSDLFIDLVGATITAPSPATKTGIPLFNTNSALSFFSPNDDGTGTPTWSYFTSSTRLPALAAGTSETIDLGQLDVSAFLAYVNAHDGPGTYSGTLDYTISAFDDATFASLPDITVGSPSIEINVTILPATSTPEPGMIATVAGMGIAATGFLMRRRK